MIDKDYLFVYGTLRNGYDLKLRTRVAKDLEYIGKAKVEASLYDLGRYPGAVKGKEKSEVIGDVFIISNPDKVLNFLDKYEGDEFDRKRQRVKLKSGKFVNAWIYWYNLKPEARQKIHYKDYFNYLRNKKTA
jgi:gamma-glutamylcyclotransferase (GGCT)/AIG2-like uncharacterized protein YtfP